MLDHYQNLVGELHIALQILIALVFLGLASWAIWAIIKMFLNIFGIKRDQSPSLKLTSENENR